MQPILYAMITVIRSFYLFLFIFTVFASTKLEAQILQPAKWKTDVSAKTVTIGDEIDLIFLVDLQKDWYIYSTDFDPDLGPMVTEFNFKPNPSYELIGEIRPINPKKKYDDLWQGEYTYFDEKAEFRQTIKVLQKNLIIEGDYAYQVCTDVDGKCIPFDDEFKFSGFTVNEPLSSLKEEAATKTTGEKSVVNAAAADNDTADTITNEAVLAHTQEANDGANLPFGLDEPTSATQGSEKEKSVLSERSPNDPYSLLGFMLVAFLGGLAALLTPCVFPMIPLTVTFFTSSGKGKGITKALVYGISIIVIYVLAGTIVALVNGPEFANWLSTHWLPNVFFFAIFLFFALAFLGLFEITLPSNIVNKVDRESDKGGYYGVFFMAFTLVLVSFSCTAPIVGSLLVEAAGGQVVKPILGMLAFALAFAIPFTLFAIFPNWLNNLPKSGGWLNSVKVSLGFLELALGLKFLSVADQVYHWGLLDREIYLTLWIVIFGMWGFYLLGKIRLPNDSKIESIGVPRLMLAIAVFSFTLYLIPGLFGAPLKALAGYLPPMSTHDFDLPAIIRDHGGAAGPKESVLCDEPKHANMLSLPHGLQGYFDYEQALACARQQNKPLFIDFTGHGCVNCREMEARVWSDPKVLERLRNDFVIVALYVDEKTELPESEWYESSYDNKIKKSIGKQNVDFQITRFNNNAQPYYVLLNTDEMPLVPPKAYDLNVQNFIDFLDEGLNNFRNK